MSHPLDGASFRFRNFKGFGSGGPFIDFAPISVLVGTNNSGKSAVIDAIDVVLSGGKSVEEHYSRFGERFSVEVRSVPPDSAYKQAFRHDVRSSGINLNNDWLYGQNFLGQRITRAYGPDWQPVWVDGPKFEAAPEGTRENFKRNSHDSLGSRPEGYSGLRRKGMFSRNKKLRLPLRSNRTVPG